MNVLNICSTERDAFACNTPQPLERLPKLLGVRSEPFLFFSHHIQTTMDRAAARLEILKALLGTNCEQQKLTITITYEELVWSIITHATRIWALTAYRHNVRKLQVIQNTALRSATSCHQRVSSAQLHMETMVFPNKDNLDLLCGQYLASAICSSHPSHALVTQSSGTRIKIFTWSP